MMRFLRLRHGTRITGAILLTGLASLSARAATPDLNGYWMVDRYIETVRTLDGNTPPLKPEARSVYDQRVAEKKAGKTDFDPLTKCIGPGVPRVMFLPYAIEFLQRPHELTMLFAWNHLYRNIDLSGKKPVVDYPMFIGVGTGKWDGNALVIETNGLRDDALLDASGLPMSSKLRVTERYSLSANGKTLTNLITIDDPQTYTQSWQTKVTYHRLPDSDAFSEDVCLDRVEAGQPAVAAPKK